MKKVLFLLTILLISCGSENGTAELDYPAEEVTGAEEKSEEVVEETEETEESDESDETEE